MARQLVTALPDRSVALEEEEWRRDMSDGHVTEVPALRVWVLDASDGGVAEFAHIATDNWAQERAGIWVVYGLLERDRRGGVYVAEVSVAPLFLSSACDRRVTADVLRLVRPAKIVEACLAQLKLHADFISDGRIDASLEDADQLRVLVAGWRAQARNARGAPLPDELYETIARTYVRLEAEGVLRGINREIATRLGLDYKRVASYVTRCEQLGLLGPATQGRAGRGPGPNLYPEGIPQ